MIVPRDPHTDVGDSEHPGGMKTYCSSAGRSSSQQGQLPDDFWSDVEFKTGKGTKGGRYAQCMYCLVLELFFNFIHQSIVVTGCIRPSHLSRLNLDDSGGQYDSSGGAGGRGNPQGSQCLGYKHYVELVEPAGPRACIKCCDDPADCPTNKGASLSKIVALSDIVSKILSYLDTQGCPNVVHGNYFNCG